MENKTSGGIKYKKELKKLQIELVKFQHHLIKYNHKILIIFEGRDASGKDGVIKRIIQHLSPRETRVVALGKPSDHDKKGWYFQRYVPHLPVAQEMVLFNRSWYNRAGVEWVMGFCNEIEYKNFLKDVVVFESLLVDSGIQLFKFYLDISKKEQARRLKARKKDPLKQWKTSFIDEVALVHWDDYSKARDTMLDQTNSEVAPWVIINADCKKQARLNVIRYLMANISCPDKDEHITHPDSKFSYEYASSVKNKLST